MTKPQFRAVTFEHASTMRLKLKQLMEYEGQTLDERQSFMLWTSFRERTNHKVKRYAIFWSEKRQHYYQSTEPIYFTDFLRTTDDNLVVVKPVVHNQVPPAPPSPTEQGTQLLYGCGVMVAIFMALLMVILGCVILSAVLSGSKAA